MVMNRLKGKMVEMNISANELSKKTGISYGGLLKRIKGELDMSVDEAIKIADVLSISSEQLGYIFFNR